MSIKVCSFCNDHGQPGIVYWTSEDACACMCSECSYINAQATLDILKSAHENTDNPKEESNKCSFCYAENTNRVYRHNDDFSACMCGNCCVQFAKAMLEKREREGDDLSVHFLTKKISDDKENDVNIDLTDEIKLNEMLDQVQNIKVNIKKATYSFNSNQVPIKKELPYIILMLFGLIGLPGLHRLYMRAYISGILMLTPSFLILFNVLLRTNNAFNLRGHNAIFIIVVYYLQVTVTDRKKFTTLYNSLKEKLDPAYKIMMEAERAKENAKKAREADIAKENANKLREVEKLKKIAKNAMEAEIAKENAKNARERATYKVARSTCTKCHLIKPRTEMKLVKKSRSSGSSIGYGFKSKNYSIRGYTRHTQVWVCNECNKSWW